MLRSASHSNGNRFGFLTPSFSVCVHTLVASCLMQIWQCLREHQQVSLPFCSGFMQFSLLPQPLLSQQLWKSHSWGKSELVTQCLHRAYDEDRVCAGQVGLLQYAATANLGC